MYKVSPIPIKRRVRFTKTGHSYTDVKTADDLRRVANCYTGEYHPDEPLRLRLQIVKPLPKSKNRPEPFTAKPDIDNVIKAVMDGLNGKAFKDDSQIVEVIAEKTMRTHSAEECVLFNVEVINGQSRD